MPRQNFISRNFFVEASEKETQQAILTIPRFAENIKLIEENKVLHSIRFLFEHPGYEIHQHMDVSILPLNNSHTRVTLHASYPNGHVFSNDSFINNALINFESAVHSALNGYPTEYKPCQRKAGPLRKILELLPIGILSLGLYFIWKKDSNH